MWFVVVGKEKNQESYIEGKSNVSNVTLFSNYYQIGIMGK
jgi:hypothetical protein